MANQRSVTNLTEQAAAGAPSRGLSFFRESTPADADGPYDFVSYEELERETARYGGALRELGLSRGDRFAFVASSLRHTVPLTLGALRIGVVPMPLAPPATASELALYAERAWKAVATAGASTLVAASALHPLLGETRGSARVVPLELLTTTSTLAESEPAADDDVALLQLDTRKNGRLVARAVRHGELFDALSARVRELDVRDDDSFASWLPLSQDAGVLALLLPLFTKRHGALLSPVHFLKRPARWLQMISRTRATIVHAPEHGFAYCTRRVQEQELDGLDLASVRVAAPSEGELSAATRASFARRFARLGFLPSAFTTAPTPVVVALGHHEEQLSRGQQALWFLAQLAPDSDAYHIPLCFRITSRLSTPALARALSTLAERHPALRTIFPSRHGLPYRQVVSAASVALEEVDGTRLSLDERNAWLSESLRRPFDLETGPLFVARLLRVSVDESWLLLVAHHINVDAISFLLLGSELSVLYGLSERDVATLLPAPSHSYDDFVDAQSELLGGPEGERLGRYWREQLALAPSSLGLPYDKPRPPFQTYRGASVPVRLPPGLTRALTDFAAQHHTTSFTVLLAVYQTLLFHHTGARDLLVATPVAGRTGVAFDDVVGYFVNTLPLRGRLDETLSFEQLVAQQQETVLSALDHQDLPFARIVELAQQARDPSRPPLCQVMFQLQTHKARAGVGDVMRAGNTGAAAQLGGLVIEPLELPRRIAQFDLTLDLTDFGAGISGHCDYNTDLFEASTVARLVADFVRLAEVLVSQPKAPLAAHRAAATSTQTPAPPRLPAAQRALVLERWNDTAVSFPDGRVHLAIAQRAAEHPDTVALELGDHTLTYGALNLRANRIAQRLRALGATRDVLVGVCMERSLDLVTVLLAVLKAGAAYVPLDPTLPDARLAYMLDDADPTIVVVDDAHRARVATSRGHVLDASTVEQIASVRFGVADPVCHARPEDLAYVIYTSGSTGQPKGVGNTHGGLWNRLSWQQAYLRLDASDVVLQKTPYSFDVSVWELFWPLMVGARLAIARPEGHKDTSYLLGEIARAGVTTIHFVPSMLEAFLREPDLSQAHTLARVVCSGEALSYALSERCSERLPQAALHNLYGPTEASIDVTAHRCTLEEARSGSGTIVPIGRPIANTEIYILDEQREPVAVGATGELYIGGVGLARGYHGRPELTSERFVPHPIRPGTAARLYKTGDLARFRADGVIEYLGRNDDQLKLRGFRVELGEIEAALRAEPGVTECVVAARALPSGGTRLEAFVVLRDGTTTKVETLVRAVSARLPEYMVPSLVHAIDAVPLTHSGKADRRALLERTPSTPKRAAAHVAPRSAEERALSEIWQEVLGIPEPSVNDNYFALGGDSIRSLTVRALAKRRGFDLPIQALLAHQTIAALADTLRAHGAPEPELARAPFSLVRPSERAALARYEDAYPATQLQLGMLYHSELTEASWAYHDVMSFELALHTPFDEPAMRAALGEVVARHPVLRSAFDVAGFAEPLQVIERTVALPLRTRDLRGLDSGAAQRAIEAHIADDKRSGYRLHEAPLFRVMIHLLDVSRVRLSFGFHHAILDGWSAASFLRELFAGYLQHSHMPGSELLPVATAPRHRFSELSALEREAITSQSSRTFWRERLHECTVSRLPRWPARYRRDEPGSARSTLEVDGALTSRLSALAAELGVPVKALLLAAHVRTLATFTGTDDVVTGRVLHGRPELEGAEHILGLFLNTVPLRVDVRAASWATLIEAVVDDERAVFAHRHFPLREIQRSVEQATLFETAFNFVHFHLYDELAASGLVRVLGYEAHENTALGLMVNFVLSPQTGLLSLQLEYDAQQVAAAQATQLGRAHLRALEALVANVAADAADARLLGDEEVALLTSSAGQRTRLSDAPVHLAFERRAALTPDAIAVELDGATLSYAALDAQANAVAARLHSVGVLAGSAVALCVEPSFERAATVLGVLKAGCAYLPLDPSFPTARLSYLLSDAEPKVVLVSPAHARESFLEGQNVLVIDTREQRGLPDAPRLTTRVSAYDPAYLIYTSGSTGQPKGIVMPHGPLSNLISWQVSESGPTRAAVTAQFSAFSFDVSFQEMFSTWAAGGRLVFVPEACRKDARELAKLLISARVTRLFLPVVMLLQLTEVAEALDLTLPDLREVNCAGEQLEISDAVRWFFTRHRACSLHNHYGPSETHVATAHALSDDVSSWPFAAPIGKPLPGVRAYVLDPRGEPAPLAVPGELFLGGACVASGYHGRPELTAERFVHDPRARTGDDRMYRTGDIARVLPDGQLEFLGRRDDQLKIRGFRVELAEVEAGLVASAGEKLARVVVTAVPSRSRASRHELAAYVVPREGVVLDKLALERAAAQRLPAHMLPSTITVLSSLPLTPSGKVDRRALPSPTEHSDVVRTHVPPSTPRELELVGLWREVLAVPELGVTDDFFLRGGDSLGAVRLMARIQRRFAVDLPIAALLENPTVRALASLLEHSGGEHEVRSLIALRSAPESQRPPVFCVHPVGGNVLCYAALARALGPDQPLYGLSARGLSGRSPPHTSVVEMAAAYASEIVRAQPEGAIHLAGWSFGGIVAVEIARQLRSAGRTLAPVLVMDTIASVRFEVVPSDDDLFECVAMELFGAQLDEEGFAHILQRDQGTSQGDRFARLLELARSRGLLPEGASSAQLEHVFAVIHANIRAGYDHQAKPFDGSIVLLRCTDAMPPRLRRLHDMVGSAYDEAQNGWGPHCRALEVVPVRGDHLTIVFEPHVAQVAAIARRIVDATLARDVSP